jgi:hypothetical protein
MFSSFRRTRRRTTTYRRARTLQGTCRSAHARSTIDDCLLDMCSKTRALITTCRLPSCQLRRDCRTEDANKCRCAHIQLKKVRKLIQKFLSARQRLPKEALSMLGTALTIGSLFLLAYSCAVVRVEAAHTSCTFLQEQASQSNIDAMAQSAVLACCDARKSAQNLAQQ